MVIKARLDVDELVKEDRVHKRVFRDPDIFELEMERIFYRTWVYVGHETEIAQLGDYKTTWIGDQPVLVTRGADDGQVYVLYNSCRHRGATVCQQECGNANFFRCGYHGWTYNNQGDNIGVPYKEAYGDDFDTSELGLVRVPRVGSYGGFIFASLSPTGPSLEEHLGNARRYLDYFACQGPQGITVRTDLVHKTGYNGNWKYQMENIVDHYHTEFVHKSAFEARARRTGRIPPVGGGPDYQWSRDVGNGHAVNGYLDDLNRRPYTYNDIGGFKISIFPNLLLIDVQIRHVVPKAVDRSELWVHPVLLKGVPLEKNEGRLRKHEDAFGPGGFIAPDDWEMFDRVQRGAQARGNEWLLYSRSLHNERSNELGEIVTPAQEKPETTLRAIYKQWKRLMAAE